MTYIDNSMFILHTDLDGAIRALDLCLYRCISTSAYNNPAFFDGYWSGSTILLQDEISMVYNES